MTPALRISKRNYLSTVNRLYPRLDELNDLRRRNLGDLTPELAAERAEIEQRINEAGMNLWTQFQKYAESMGCKPITRADVKRYLEGRNDV